MDNICISTRGLVVQKYYRSFNIHYYRMWHYDLLNYHIYMAFMNFYFIIKYYILIYILRFNTFWYNMLSIVYHLLSHIYHAVWLVIIFEYLLYFILLVFWFQNYGLNSEIYSYFKIILQNMIPWELTLIYFVNVSPFL